MSGLADILAIPEHDADDEPWFIEAKDRNPASELERQMTFLALLKRLGPSCDAVAIPNAGRASDWERIQRWKEGARAGALDLVITWEPGPKSAGVFFAEMKDGKKMPTPPQRERLNRLYKMGHQVGVFRTAETLIAHLRAAGAPIRAARI